MLETDRDVLVIGATGATGRHAYRECLHAGLKVEALVRQQSVARARDLLGDEAKLVVGDLTQPSTLGTAFAGVKRVILAIGKRCGEKGSSPEVIDYQGICNVVAEAKRGGSVDKIVHVTTNGVDSPNTPFIALLNVLTGMRPGWKVRGEQALRDSGIPYVVVRPVGLKNKGDDVAPIVKQCKPYEWGICKISRAVVGCICVQALLHAPSYCTLNCREDPAGKPASLKDMDWKNVMGGLHADVGPIPATFEDHAASAQALKKKAAMIGAGVAALLLIAVWWRSAKSPRSRCVK
eukprot:gnl/TRDRNA2_/TRDRNA2_173540_c0_seq12.p1 gnl/TRDRNA2_/TRDRNA2_173540_c0~~gnl/TRDRNA2_/TRDRNA2_173540_c0_seq12.p1  ORF type:complete len:292 (-),score=31.84 gnl/TRDRNA2_/TRDRNA2_173540_c0_seq12:177-1052(-)